jgi:hypothetical protein
MALLAGDSRMRSSQWESAGGVIELGVKPIIQAVALVTSRGELGSHVARVRGLLKGL